MPIIEVVDYQEKKFIVLWCPGGETRPYSSPKTMEKDNKERIHYIRKGSNTIEPSDEDEKDLFGLANRVPFDDRVNHQAELSDLNIALIQNFATMYDFPFFVTIFVSCYLTKRCHHNTISNIVCYKFGRNLKILI